MCLIIMTIILGDFDLQSLNITTILLYHWNGRYSQIDVYYEAQHYIHYYFGVITILAWFHIENIFIVKSIVL